MNAAQLRAELDGVDDATEITFRGYASGIDLVAGDDVLGFVTAAR